MTDYASFIDSKTQLTGTHGFEPSELPDFLFDFQRALVTWAIRKGRCALFADCGLGKTPMQLVWADQVARHTGGRVLILAPLAVASQTVREGEKFSIDVAQCRDGVLPESQIVVTNYERLHLFDVSDFFGVVCDESSIVKNFNGKRRAIITEFLRTQRYRLLCTATASPNDYIELGTHSEALGELGYTDMLQRFFKNDGNTVAGFRGATWGQIKWRFKKHAEHSFWRWVCSWARAIRKPSDLGFDDVRFVLPELIHKSTIIAARTAPAGMLFDLPASNLHEQREEKRRTIRERCEAVAEKVSDTGHPAVAWCHLNDEGDLLAALIPDSVQVSGSDSDESKEEKFLAFAAGDIRVMVTKPKIGSLGLNWQHCNHQTFFPSHSFEQYYQGVRRSWRFGQTRPVTIDIISTPGDANVMGNLRRKAEAADSMFRMLVACMNDPSIVALENGHTNQVEIPQWL